MFLNEVALGKPKEILQGDSSLRAAPPGFDCIWAKGNTEPDEKQDKKLKFGGNEVIVPVGRPKNKNLNSAFSQSEYLVYKESQVRMRYLFELDM